MTPRPAVLGGGIAGAAAALRLAQGGASPLWIAAPSKPSFKPGEHLSAAAIPLLKALNSDALLRAEVHRLAHGTYSAWGSKLLVERNAIVQLEGAPIVLDRTAFEAALGEQAITAGAERIERDVRSLKIDGQSWVLSLGDQTIRVPFVFDATGRKAIVASKFAPRFQADQLTCQVALFSCDTCVKPRPVTLIEAQENGWWYLSVLADQRAVLNFYTDADLPAFDPGTFAENAATTEAIATFLQNYGFRIEGPATRMSTNSTWIAPAIGAGWAAIGDATAAFDPLSSHGMTTALWTAIQASDAWLAQDTTKMRQYADAVAQGIQEYLATRARVYAQEQRWPHSPFWARRIQAAPIRNRPQPAA